MAESVVSSVVKELGDLLIQEANFLHGLKEQVERLQTELRHLQSFLKDADKRQDEDETVRDWVSEIREVAYDVEDVIKIFVFEVASRRREGHRNAFKRYACIVDEEAELQKVGSKIEVIKNRISSLITSLRTYGINPKSEEGGGEGGGCNSVHKMQRLWTRSSSHVEEYTVGLDEDVKILVATLVEVEVDCRIVSIWGISGLGKTTIAKKVYHHNEIRRHFEDFAWASQQRQLRDVFEGILLDLISPSEEKKLIISKFGENELVEKLYTVLLKKRCLVVLDDIWSSEAWDNLSRAFPINENGESKILLTTRNEAVARRVGDGRFIYEPQPLNEKESWELLGRKALRGKDDPDMAELGKKMVEMCVGLPLAIVLLGGILATKHSLNEWRLVHENIISDLKRGKYLGVSKVLALSYHELPNKLKACFLHLCDFPEDIDIPRRKLVMIWMAEGIVSGEVEKGEKMEDVGERYLGELLDRGMVQAEVVGSTGRVKTCRLHNHMRDLCLLKANQDNFLKIVHTHNGNEPVISVASRLTIAKSSRVHRLAIYLGRKTSRHFSWERERTPYLRSLFINAHGYDTRISKKIKSRFGDFKLLKILDLERCCVEGNLPRAMGNLIHLRYLGLNCSLVTSIPSSFGNLRYLQTLILMGSSRVKIPNVICKMGQLRYLYFNVYSSSGKLRLDNLGNLQTLEGFEPESFDVKELTKLTNLRKLQIYLESFQELEGILRSSPVTALNCLRSLKLDWYNRTMEGTHLQILFSACHDLHNLFLGDRMGKLPEYTQFPQNLSKLTLQYSGLEEDPMATLEKLPNLTILRLYRQAFIGKEMVCSSEGFPQLKYLALSGLPWLEEWFVSEHALPNLCELVIGDCSKLRMVPDGLSFIATLRELQIIRMPEEFKDRLQRACNGRGELIQTGEDTCKVRHVPYIRIK